MKGVYSPRCEVGEVVEAGEDDKRGSDAWVALKRGSEGECVKVQQEGADDLGRLRQKQLPWCNAHIGLAEAQLDYLGVLCRRCSH